MAVKHVFERKRPKLNIDLLAPGEWIPSSALCSIMASIPKSMSPNVRHVFVTAVELQRRMEQLARFDRVVVPREIVDQEVAMIEDAITRLYESLTAACSPDL